MTAPVRLFALMVWTPALGAALTPVGALAVADGPDGLQRAVSLIPGLDGRDEPWRQRLADPTTEQQLARWSAEDSACVLAVLPVPPNTVDLAGAAEAGVDELLSTVWPALHEAGAL